MSRLIVCGCDLLRCMSSRPSANREMPILGAIVQRHRMPVRCEPVRIVLSRPTPSQTISARFASLLVGAGTLACAETFEYDCAERIEIDLEVFAALWPTF